MEFDIDVKHGWHGHVEITDYSRDYGLYYSEDAQGIASANKFKYSQTNTLNVVIKVNTDSANLLGVFLDEHDTELEKLAFDITQDGYYTVTHFVLPTAEWLQLNIQNHTDLLSSFSVIYFIEEGNIKKRTIINSQDDQGEWDYTVGPVETASVREILERNIDGTTLQKCVINVFYTGFLQDCYINICKDLFNKYLQGCRPNCQPKNIDTYPRDFLWMTLNIIDYLIDCQQFMEAQRLLELINYCGGFCKNINNGPKSSCGCNSANTRPACGCSQA